jgi:hypothetical protein
MNTSIARKYQRRRPVQRGLSGAERMGVSHEAFVQPGDVVTVTASAGRMTSGDLPVLYPIGTAMKATGTLTAMVRVRLVGVAVVAASA